MEPVHPLQMISAASRERLLRESASPPPTLEIPAVAPPPEGLVALDESMSRLADLARRLDTTWLQDDPLDLFLGTAASAAAGADFIGVQSLLAERLCGLQAAATARSLLDGALLWAWIAEDRAAREHVVGALASAEWKRVSEAAAECGISEAAAERWRPSTSDELAAFDITRPEVPGGRSSEMNRALLAEVADGGVEGRPADLLRFLGLRLASAVLAECGHFNRFAAHYAPLDLTSGAHDEAVGSRLSGSAHAIVAQVAAVSYASICLAT